MNTTTTRAKGASAIAIIAPVERAPAEFGCDPVDGAVVPVDVALVLVGDAEPMTWVEVVMMIGILVVENISAPILSMLP